MMKFDGFKKKFFFNKKNEKFNFKLNHGQDFLFYEALFIQIEWTT